MFGISIQDEYIRIQFRIFRLTSTSGPETINIKPQTYLS